MAAPGVQPGKTDASALGHAADFHSTDRSFIVSFRRWQEPQTTVVQKNMQCDRERWFKRPVPSALLAMVVVFCVGVFATYGWSAGQTVLCVPDEKLALCARNWVNAAGNIAAFGAASVAAYFAYRQARAAQKTADASFEALKADRAWLLPQSLNWETRDNNKFVVSIQWINGGRTPATRSRLSIAQIRKPGAETPAFARITEPIQNFAIVGPGATVHTGTLDIPFKIAAQTKSGEYHIFIYSYAEYDTIYQPGHGAEVTYRLSFVFAEDGSISTVEGLLVGSQQSIW